MEPSERALEIFSSAGVILENQHFVYVSGDHGSGWVNKDVLYVVPQNVRELTQLLSSLLHNIAADVVCGPATGGLVISQWLAYEMKLLSVFAEHDPNAKLSGEDRPICSKFILRRHYDEVVQGKRVIVVDDIVNTGHSTKQTIAAVRQAGGEVVCAATLCTRGNVSSSDIGAPAFIALSEVKMATWPGEGCHLCAREIPINEKYAHGSEFVRRRELQKR